MFKLYLKIFIISILLVGCGYRPTRELMKENLGHFIYVQSIINLKNPINSVIVKDALVESIIKKTSAKIVNTKSLATSIMYIEIKSVRFSSIQKDEKGYDITFETTVKLQIKNKNKNKNRVYNLIGRDIFELKSGSVASDINKRDSIKRASIKAINEFLSRISI